MSDLLQKLQSNEAILLMYLSGELGEEDRADVERMLSSDSALRTQLEGLEQAQASSQEALRRLDRLAPGPDALVLSRRMMRAVRRHHLERQERPIEQEETERVGRPWWTYGLGTSAAAALLLLVWWTYQEPAVTEYPGWARPTQPPVQQFPRASGREWLEDFLPVSEPMPENIGSVEAHFTALASGEIEQPFFYFDEDLFEEF
jgi:hypothetical protein